MGFCYSYVLYFLCSSFLDVVWLGFMCEFVKGYDNVGYLVFIIICFLFVDNYNFDDLEKEYLVMLCIFCGFFFIFVVIVLMNLYIVLLLNMF